MQIATLNTGYSYRQTLHVSVDGVPAPLTGAVVTWRVSRSEAVRRDAPLWVSSWDASDVGNPEPSSVSTGAVVTDESGGVVELRRAYDATSPEEVGLLDTELDETQLWSTVSVTWPSSLSPAQVAAGIVPGTRELVQSWRLPVKRMP